MRRDEEESVIAIGIAIFISIIYALVSIFSSDENGKKGLNININTGPTRLERIRDFYRRRREAYLRMHREKFIVWSSDKEEFQRRWKRKWIEEGYSSYSYDRLRDLEDIW